jgi:hypothetical protein
MSIREANLLVAAALKLGGEVVQVVAVAISPRECHGKGDWLVSAATGTDRPMLLKNSVSNYSRAFQGSLYP